VAVGTPCSSKSENLMKNEMKLSVRWLSLDRAKPFKISSISENSKLENFVKLRLASLQLCCLELAGTV